MPRNGISAAFVKASLRKRYATPEWAVLFEVADRTGAGAARRADAVAMNLYPSRGLELHGFEIKVSRADWRRELVDPAKAEAHFGSCDRWWIVAPPGVVAEGELPTTWGRIEIDVGTGALRQVVAAPKVEAEPWSRSFVAAMLRRASEVDGRMIDEIVERKVAVLRERDRQEAEGAARSANVRLQALEKIVADIEATSGLKIGQWSDGGQIGRAVAAVHRLGLFATHSRLASTVQSLRTVADAFEAEVALLTRELEPAVPAIAAE